MTERASPSQRALDLLVYAPTGLLLTVAEELPQLAAKGRRRVEGQVTTARVVGQFSVQLARRQIRARRRRPARTESSGSGTPTAAASDPRSTSTATSTGSASGDLAAARGVRHQPSGSPVTERPRGADGSQPLRSASLSARGARDAPTSPAGDVSSLSGGSSSASRPRSTRAAGSAQARRTARGTASGGASRSSGSSPSAIEGATETLGIPGYDSLSASQVVQRLPGLSPADLRRVHDHEVSHRHRRTILNRAEQLLDGAGEPNDASALGGVGERDGAGTLDDA